MLVLSRTVGSRVRVEIPDGRFVWVVVVKIDRGKVRLGFDADRDVSITREELLSDFAPTDGRAAK